MPAAFGVGYQVIEYPHIQRRHKIMPRRRRFKVIDVAIPPALTVGYIMGVGDQVPAALQQLGARVTLIDSDEMAWGDLVADTTPSSPACAPTSGAPICGRTITGC